MRNEEPQPVPLNRAAQGPARIKNVPDAGHGLETAGLQGVGQVGALQARARVEAGGAAREAVAALLGNHVHHGTVGVGFGRDPTRGEHRFLRRIRVRGVADVPCRMEDAHAVEIDVGANLAVETRADIPGVAAGDLEAFVAFEPGGQRHERLYSPHTGRQRLEQIGGDHGLLASALRVDERRRAGHGDRLLEGADFHVGIHRRREPSGQLDAFPLQDAETAQREGDDIGARPQIDDVVPALVVGHDTADLFDQGRTGGFHRDARQHRA